MNQHVPDDLLQDFVEGDVGEQVAIHIAEHLDECPTCLNRAAGVEPLAAAFAAMSDPVVPEGLVHAILAEADLPERLPITELGISAGLVAAAGMITTMFGNPVALAAEFGVVLSALGDVMRVVGTGLSASTTVLIVATAFAVGGMYITARFAEPLDLPALPGNRRLL